MKSKEEAKIILEEFLNFPLTSTNEIFEKFATLPNTKFYKGNKQKQFMIVEGTREDKAVLVAHADTVWHEKDVNSVIRYANGVYSSGNEACGIGADDRAGLAILWLLAELGHTLLITDGEEKGLWGSRHLKEEHKKQYNWLNDNHTFFMQFDRQNANEVKYYNIPVTEEFKNYIQENTQYIEPDNLRRTDICFLCGKICGCNLSVGYKNEHKANEELNYEQWYNTYKIVYAMLEKKLDKYYLKEVE